VDRTYQLAVAFAATIILVHLFQRAARHFSLVDVPYGRKAHEGNIPLVGGIAIFAAFIFSAFLDRESLIEFNSLFAGVVLLVVVGVLDDLHDLSPRSRFFAQIMASLLMASWGGVSVETLGNLLGTGPVALNNWVIPFTVVCVIGTINAFNMIDGMDGLAGGIALIALVLFGLAAHSAGLQLHAKLLFILAGAVCGFLLFNLRAPWRPQATVFLGNAGSMMLGFIFAWFAVNLAAPNRDALAPITAVWVLAVPLMDMASIMARRLERGVSPFQADAQHIHHLLQRIGFSVPKAALSILAASLLLGLVGLGAERAQVPEYIMFYSFLGLLLVYHWGMRRTWQKLERRVSPLRVRKQNGAPESIDKS